ncbi:MAG TPA: hypothetical protein VI199_03905 [Novosphingobium sp.]
MTRRLPLLCLSIGLAATAASLARPANAQMSPHNAQAGARVLSFLLPPLSGPVTAAIVYKPGDPASESEAQAIQQSLGEGLVVGPMTLKPRRVATDALGGLAGAKVAFITRGANYRAIAAAAAQRGIIAISSDAGCVESGFCAVTISSGAKIQITVSRAACKAAGIRFGAAFLMLVKEI